jgi:hypothetical protein
VPLRLPAPPRPPSHGNFFPSFLLPTPFLPSPRMPRFIPTAGCGMAQADAKALRPGRSPGPLGHPPATSRAAPTPPIAQRWPGVRTLSMERGWDGMGDIVILERGGLGWGGVSLSWGVVCCRLGCCRLARRSGSQPTAVQRVAAMDGMGCDCVGIFRCHLWLCGRAGHNRRTCQSLKHFHTTQSVHGMFDA